MKVGKNPLAQLQIPRTQLPALVKAFKPLETRVAVSSWRETPAATKGGIAGKTGFPDVGKTPRPAGPVPIPHPNLPPPFSRPLAPLKPAEFSTKMLHNVTQAGVSLLSKLPSQVRIYNQLAKVAKMAGQVSQLSLSAQSLSNVARTGEVGRTGQQIKIQKGIRELASMISGGKGNDAIQKRWKSFVSDIARGGAVADINAVMQFVLRQSYLETNKDLQFYADKVKYYNDMKEAIRDHLTQAREKYADFTAFARDQGIDPEGGSGLQAQKFSTKEELAKHIQKTEEQLQTVGDDAQLANVDMQNMLQKQQQTLQTMSQISKQLHDTAMAIVRKIGG